MEAYRIEMNNSKVIQLPDILHCFRVAYLSEALCKALNLNNKLIKEVFISALLHDIGKSMVDLSVLNKDERLTQVEWNSIKYHAEIGGVIAANMGQPPAIVKNIVHHHENYDGSGYPRKLKGSCISIGAQIIRICDTYDALRMQRSYKRAFSHEEALQEMLKERGKYNPIFLESFLSIEFDKIKGIEQFTLLYS